MRKLGAQGLLLVVAGCGLCAHADPILALIPASGLVTAEPGQTIGWGFSITNDTPYYLLIDSSNFCGVGGDPFFTDCTDPYNPPTAYGPALGTYSDLIATNATVVSPFSTFTQDFDLTNQVGVGEYTVDPSAPLYSVDTGNIYVSYMEFQGNPFLSGTQVSGDIEFFAPAQVEVVPEPAAWALTALPLLLLIWRVRRKRPG